MTRRDEIALAVFGIWITGGLFLDGWAHNAGKPETFFTPWHAVLYSGILASIAWFTFDGYRHQRDFSEPAWRPLRWAGILVAAGGVGDMLWHTAFGVEEDVEALLSPTHLLLMSAGLVLMSTPLRNLVRRGAGPGSLREFAPALVGLTGVVAFLGFFLQFASAFKIEDHLWFSGSAPDEAQVLGITSILLTNVMMVGAAAWTLRHWRRPPMGTFTLLLSGAALLMAGLIAFDQVALVLAAGAGGLVGDLAVRRGHAPRVTLVATPVVLWTAWFGVYHAVWGLGWAPELWTGSIFLAALTGYGLSLLASPNLASPLRNGSSQGPKLAEVDAQTATR